MTQLASQGAEAGARKLATVFAPNEALRNLGFTGVEGKTVADIHPHGFDHIAALVMLEPVYVSCIGVRVDDVVEVEAMLAAAELPHEVTTTHVDEVIRGADTPGEVAVYDVVTIANVPTGQESTLISAASRLVKPGGELLVSGGNAGFFSRANDIERVMRRMGFPNVGSIRTWGTTRLPMGHNTLTVGTRLTS
jgi:hypothetical protein